jgi:hypothetical protein
VAQTLISLGSMVGFLSESARIYLYSPPGSDDPRDKDKRDRDPQDPEEAPETPPDEPRPPRVEDPPAQQEKRGPYVVQADAPARREQSTED